MLIYTTIATTVKTFLFLTFAFITDQFHNIIYMNICKKIFQLLDGSAISATCSLWNIASKREDRDG